MTDPILGLIGLSKKAGRIAIGDDACKASVFMGRGRLLLLASDASERTKKLARTYAAEGGIPLKALPFAKEDLGAALGRAVCALCVIEDAGFAKAIEKKIDLYIHGGGTYGTK